MLRVEPRVVGIRGHPMRVYGVERRKKKKREEGCKVVVKRVDENDLNTDHNKMEFSFEVYGP